MADNPRCSNRIRIEPHHSSFLRVLREGILCKSGGEVMARYKNETGRICVVDGRVAWVVTSLQNRTFQNRLVDRALIDGQDLDEVFNECKRSGQHFAETIVQWHLLDQETVRKELLDHVATRLLELLSWPSLQTMFVPVNRSYNPKLTFHLKELFQTAIAIDPQGDPSLTRAHQLIRDWLSLALDDSRQKEVKSAAVSLQEDTSLSVDKIRQTFEVFRKDAADALLASGIIRRADAQSIVDYNSNPAAWTLFNRLSRYLDESLKGAELPPVNRYLCFDLEGNKSVILVNLGPEYLWCLFCDTAKIQLGMLLNVIIPNTISKFQDAMSVPSLQENDMDDQRVN